MFLPRTHPYQRDSPRAGHLTPEAIVWETQNLFRFNNNSFVQTPQDSQPGLCPTAFRAEDRQAAQLVSGESKNIPPVATKREVTQVNGNEGLFWELTGARHTSDICPSRVGTLEADEDVKTGPGGRWCGAERGQGGSQEATSSSLLSGPAEHMGPSPDTGWSPQS